MISRRKTNRNLAYATLLTAPLLLGACDSFGPWPMPTGYTYEGSQYKAAPGPEPVFKTWEHDHAMQPSTAPVSTRLNDDDAPVNGTATTVTTDTTTTTMVTPTLTAPSPDVGAQPLTGGTWDQAAHELVSRLMNDFGHPAEAVWLQSDGGMTGQSPQFEAALRNALQQDDVRLAKGPGEGPFTLHYNIGSGDGAHSLLTITLLSSGHKATEESGLYAVGGVAPVEPMPVTPDAAAAITPENEPPPPPPPASMAAPAAPVHLSQPDDHGGGYHD